MRHGPAPRSDQLESAPGNGALAPASVELRLWLPGSVGFELAEE